VGLAHYGLNALFYFDFADAFHTHYHAILTCRNG
jgi:hypothetical protein